MRTAYRSSRPPLAGRAVRFLLRLGGAVTILWLATILLYRWLDPPITPLMLLRLPETHRIDRRWLPLGRISPELQEAVIASEDNRFCLHHGIDWGAVSGAIDEFETEGRLRGASTITMQTARNLFLWPGGGFFRKGLEAGLALAIDALWPKRRIIEVYLNVIEWGDGIYGAEAASQAFFHEDARRLSRREAALMAAVLPNPRRWSATPPERYVAERAALIAEHMGRLDGYYGCLR